MHTYICLYRGVCLSLRGFCPGVLFGSFLSGRFCPGCVPLRPLLSEYILYYRKLNTTFNFRLHIYEIFSSETSHALGPLHPVTNCHTFSDPLSPLERDVLF